MLRDLVEKIIVLKGGIPMELAFHEKFVLLTINDETGAIAFGYSKSYGFAGALLLEMVNSEVIELKDKRIHILKTKLDSEILQEAINLLKNKKKPQKIINAIQIIGNKMQKKFDNVIDNLIVKGILYKEEKKVLWVFTSKRYPTNNPTPENLIKSKIKGIILYGNQANRDSMDLISLVHILNLQKKIFSKEEMKNAKKKIKEIIKEEKISKNPQSIFHQQIMKAVMISIAVTSATNTWLFYTMK